MANLSDEDRLMFSRFMEWFNGLKNDKGNGSFNFKDKVFQAFLNANGVKFLFCKNVPKTLRGANVVAYNPQQSAVYNLARHIRNAFAHSMIEKKKGSFVMSDIRKRKGQAEIVTMRGKIAEDVMPGLLSAIQANRKAKNKK